MNLALLLPLLAFAMAAAMTSAWSIARHPGKSGWTDTIWSYAVGGCGVAAALLAPSGPAQRHWLLAAMIGLWGLRLGTHILKRTLKGRDDPRYAQLRRDWGRAWERRLLRFLLVQAAAGLVLLVAILASAANPAPFPAWSDWAGLALILFAGAGEGIADSQLRVFAADPANQGKVMDRGLWAVSRHPNYFFEWLGWWAFALIAIGPAGDWPWGYAALIGPLFVYWLLNHASGIPPTEAHMLRSRGDVFRDYQRRVSAFFPWPPKR